MKPEDKNKIPDWLAKKYGDKPGSFDTSKLVAKLNPKLNPKLATQIADQKTSEKMPPAVPNGSLAKVCPIKSKQ